ncbi:virginiamycin B lyase family protein [Hahella ganghwensis]|uniref:Vgb family protein n=1 Tax=Hahella ganghwensis TaxID=286420 RepID=UPI0003A07FD1|nr:lyase [Hahella ganghwensis]
MPYSAVFCYDTRQCCRVARWLWMLMLLIGSGLSSIVNAELIIREYPVPSGARPHDVAPAVDGGVWYTAQRQGALGYLDPDTGQTEHIPLGEGSAPHGVIVGPDGAPWITDGGQNVIVRVDPESKVVTKFPMPEGTPYTNLNTASFDLHGVLWFTGQSGYYGRVDPANGKVEVFKSPRGSGPYGIHTTPDGEVYYASLAGSHIARVDTGSGEAHPIDPPTPNQGARRVWADSKNRIWVSEWTAGQVAVYDPETDKWREWKLPGDSPKAYAIYVDDQDNVWLSDFGNNSIVRFDPFSETFTTVKIPSPSAQVRQIQGRPGEVWAPESGQDKLMVIFTR